MGGVLLFIFSWYLCGLIVCWPVCWYRETDRRDEPVVRRVRSLLLAAQWPVRLARFVGSRVG